MNLTPLALFGRLIEEHGLVGAILVALIVVVGFVGICAAAALLQWALQKRFGESRGDTIFWIVVVALTIGGGLVWGSMR